MGTQIQELIAAETKASSIVAEARSGEDKAAWSNINNNNNNECTIRALMFPRVRSHTVVVSILRWFASCAHQRRQYRCMPVRQACHNAYACCMASLVVRHHVIPAAGSGAVFFHRRRHGCPLGSRSFPLFCVHAVFCCSFGCRVTAKFHKPLSPHALGHWQA